MKKVISAVLVGAMCAGAFTACGDKKDDKKSSGLSTKGDSKYVSIVPLDGRTAPFNESIDMGIKYSKNCAEEYEKENGEKYNPYLIKFSDDEFIIPHSDSPYNMATEWVYYDGTFSIKNGKIKFSYENYINSDDDSKININDDSYVDEDIINGTSKKLDGLSSDEKKELKKTEQKKINIKNQIKLMEKMNETGAYSNVVIPPMNYNDRFTEFSILPYIRYARGFRGVNFDYPNTLITVDDFLCADTYGIELDGKYKTGKYFTLTCDLEDTMKNDEQLSYHWESDEEIIDKMLRYAKEDYDCDDVETTIEFSDGEWEWFNADGGLINNGRYDESKDYPGLIMMYLDEDSKNCLDDALYTYPLWFYIADDGKIYYPGYVKMD